MAKLYFGVESTALTFKAERDFSDENLGLIMQAEAADPQIGFTETTTMVDQLDADGKVIGQVPQTQRNPSTPEQIAQAIGDKTLNDLLDKANAYHQQMAINEAAAKAAADYKPIEASE